MKLLFCFHLILACNLYPTAFISSISCNIFLRLPTSSYCSLLWIDFRKIPLGQVQPLHEKLFLSTKFSCLSLQDPLQNLIIFHIFAHFCEKNNPNRMRWPNLLDLFSSFIKMPSPHFLAGPPCWCFHQLQDTQRWEGDKI